MRRVALGGGLFDSVPSTRSKSKAVPKPKGPTQQVIDLYHDLYLKRHGIKPVISGGKDGKLIKTMIDTWGLDVVLGLVERFVESNDSWAVRRGWTIAALYDCAPRILTKPSHVEERTANNLAAVRRVTRRK